MMRQAPTALLVLWMFAPETALAGPRGGVTAEAPASAGREVLSPSIQAGPYQSQYGMADGHRYQFNLGAKVTVDDLPVRPFLRDLSARAAAATTDARSRGTAIKEEATGTGATGGAAAVPDAASRPTGRRSLVDAPFSPPLPPRVAAAPAPQGPGALRRFGQALRAAPGEIGATVLTASAPAPRRFLDRLRQPAVVAPKDLPGLTPEGVAAAGSADYGRRVLGEAGRPAVAAQIPAAGPQSLPLPVIVEVRLADAGAASPPAALARVPESAGLILDPSFPVLMSSPRRQTAFIRGWADSEKLMGLSLLPEVVRVSVVGSAAPDPAARLVEVPVTLHLALPAGEGIASFITRSVGGLEAQAGFRWRVARGYQLHRAAQGGTVVLSGELPVSGLDRLLAYPDVLRVEPSLAPAEPAAPAAAARKAAPAPRRRAPAAVRKAVDLTVLTTAYPWMGILIREIFFWIRAAMLRWD